MSPDTSSFRASRATGLGCLWETRLGTQLVFVIAAVCVSYYLLPSSPAPPHCTHTLPLPLPVRFLGITSCLAGRASSPTLFILQMRWQFRAIWWPVQVHRAPQWWQGWAKPRTAGTSQVWTCTSEGFTVKKRVLGFSPGVATHWSVSLEKQHLPIYAFSGFLVCKRDNKYSNSSLSQCSTLVIYLKVFMGTQWYVSWYKSFFINHTNFLLYVERPIRPLGQMDSYLFRFNLLSSPPEPPMHSDVGRGPAPAAQCYLCPTL